MTKECLLSTLSPKNIIIRMPNWLGDLVMATPILSDVRTAWPAAKLTVMCQGNLGSVIEHDPCIDEIIPFKRASICHYNRNYNDIVLPLRRQAYDLGILLTNSFSSAWWFWRGGVTHRVGYAVHWRNALLNYPVQLPSNVDHQHLVLTYKTLLSSLNIPLSISAPQIYITKKERQEALELLAQYGITNSDCVIGINPGAAYGSAKCWLPSRFQELSHRLLQHPKAKLVFFGDKAGTLLVQNILCGLPNNVVNLSGKTSLRQLMALIQVCNVFLTNDSGPMHVASALGTPFVALFGSTSDVTTGPYKGGLVIHKHVPCSPCYRRECPIDFRCMTRISVDEVYQAIKHLMHSYKID